MRDVPGVEDRPDGSSGAAGRASSRLGRIWRTVSLPAHLRRTGTIAVLVGAWLTAFNQGPQLVAGEFTPTMALQILLNVLTPFVVANLGLLSRGAPGADAGKPPD